MSKKQVRRPVSAEQAEREREAVVDAAALEQAAVLLHVLRDKWGFGKRRLRRVWDRYVAIGKPTAAMAPGKIMELIRSAGTLTDDRRLKTWDPSAGAALPVRDSVELRRRLNRARGDMRDMSNALAVLAIHDTMRFGRVRLLRLLGQLRRVTEDIDEHRISIGDVRQAMLEEAGIVVEE